MPGGVEVWHAGPNLARAHFDLGKRLIDTALVEPEIFDDNVESRCIAHIEFVESVLEMVASCATGAALAEERTRRAYSEIVQRCEAYTLDRASEKVYVTELCEAAGASERTLQHAFQKIMAMTPMAYLRRLRLHRAREALRHGVDASTTVSDVAIEWGFWHFGEFSRVYKDCFNELPSETMKRRRIRLQPAR